MTLCKSTTVADDIDIASLRERYRLEADKRRRPDTLGQYLEVKDDLAGFYETDPYTPPPQRAPLSEDTDVVVLGGGLAGLLASVRLKQAGVDDMRIVEFGGDFGGTWYWNRYPGIQCDVESYSYVPLQEEVNYVTKDRYSYGSEIFAHCRRIGQHFDLYRHAIFGVIARSIRWDHATSRWIIATNLGDEIRARFFVLAAGVLNRPKLPGIPGVRDFQGHSFHTARWDFDYTGGDETGGLTRLADKRVALIGTGATGIQCTPYLGRDAGHLYVFQRTPSPIDQRGNQKTDPEWAASLKLGWQEERQRAFYVGLIEGFKPGENDVVCDGWSEINRNVAQRLREMGNPELPREDLIKLREIEDYRTMERLRRRVDEIVTDPETAEGLKAWYRFGCKRPCFNDEFLPTFNRTNVTLVDVSEAQGIERVTEKGIVANGVEYKVDCIIYASGFEVPDAGNLRRRYGIDTIDGRDGVSLYDHWGGGIRSIHGITTRNFPNFFYIGYGQAAVPGSTTLGYDTAAQHIAYIVKEMLDRGIKSFEPSQQAVDEWNRIIQENLIFDQDFYRECTPGYFNNEGGELKRHPVHAESYGRGFYAYRQILEDWRASGDLAGFELNRK